MKENLEDRQDKETCALGRSSFRIIMVVLILAIFAGIGWQLIRDPSPVTQEPVYKGKTVSAWLRDLEVGNGPECYTALEEIGLPAVPFIYRKLEQHDSPWGNRWRDLWSKSPPAIQMFLPKPKWTRFNANRARIALDFSLERTNASPILNWLKDGNPAIREVAWSVVASGDGSEISTSEALSLSPPALKDKDVLVRDLAVYVLGRKGAAVSNMVPALIPLLSSSEEGRSGTVRVRAGTAQALGRIGPVASNTIPALMNLTKSDDTFTRLSAAAGLWRISSDQNLGLPIIIKELPTLDDDSGRFEVISYLAEMGPRAKAVFPMLVKEQSRPLLLTNYHTVIPYALKAIDPEAAAKLGVK
jgi:HEAT repeats